jgi:tRNA pseudouridine38-40 synthase
MKRYFVEVAYKGTNYSGFQIQENAITVQSEIERAFEIFFRTKFKFTGSSRTDAGVHALQNFFHFDAEEQISEQGIYNINSIISADIVVKSICQMNAKDDGNLPHARFDATSREYKYFIQQKKDPFSRDTAFYFPYPLDLEKLQQAAKVIEEYTDFTSFSKRNTQVKTFNCSILGSEWLQENGLLVYHVRSNRFLRGMVRALVGTMLQVGRGKVTIDEFRVIIESADCTQADFSAPAHGLFLVSVEYPKNFFA